jgi:hypothetical protein
MFSLDHAFGFHDQRIDLRCQARCQRRLVSHDGRLGKDEEVLDKSVSSDHGVSELGGV